MCLKAGVSVLLVIQCTVYSYHQIEFSKYYCYLHKSQSWLLCVSESHNSHWVTPLLHKNCTMDLILVPLCIAHYFCNFALPRHINYQSIWVTSWFILDALHSAGQPFPMKSQHNDKAKSHVPYYCNLHHYDVLVCYERKI